MSASFLFQPRPLEVGQVFCERRRFERRWSEVADNARSGGVETRHAWRERIESERREEIEAARKVAIDRLRVHYQKRRQEVTLDGKTEARELIDRSVVVEAQGSRLVVRGAADEAEASLIEFEYTGLGRPEPVFLAAQSVPLAAGERIDTMVPLVRGLLYRCARGTIGYTSSSPIVVQVVLASVDAGAGRFAVEVRPDPVGSAMEQLTLDGSLVLGAAGLLGFDMKGTLSRSILDRRGTTRIDAELELSVEWPAAL